MGVQLYLLYCQMTGTITSGFLLYSFSQLSLFWALNHHKLVFIRVPGSSTVTDLLSNCRNYHEEVLTVLLFTPVTFLALNHHKLISMTIPGCSTVTALLPNYRNYHKWVLTVLFFTAVTFLALNHNKLIFITVTGCYTVTALLSNYTLVY